MTDARPQTNDDRKLSVEEGRLKLDSSLAKVWGPIFVPSLLAAIVPLTTLIVTQSNERQSAFRQAQESRRQGMEAAQQRTLENGRAAASLYFDKLGDLRTKETLTPGSSDGSSRICR